MLYKVPSVKDTMVDPIVHTILFQANAFALRLVKEAQLLNIWCSLHKLYEFKSRTKVTDFKALGNMSFLDAYD